MNMKNDNPRHAGSYAEDALGRTRGWLPIVVVVVVVMALLAAVSVTVVRHRRSAALEAAASSSVSSAQASLNREAASPTSSDSTSSSSPSASKSAQTAASAAKQAKQRQLDALRTTIERQTAGYGGTWSVYVEDMTTGAAVSVNNHRQPSASVIKLYVMLAVYTRIAQGTLKEDMGIDSLLTEMITVSSNDATNTLVTTLGDGDATKGFDIVNRTAKANGFDETAMNDLLYDSGTHDSSLKHTSAEDAGRFMAKVYRGQLVSREYSRKMLALLLGQQRRLKIPAGLPSGTKVANKTGEIPGTENDAAIVYGTAADHSGDYVMTVMTQNVDNGTAQSQIRELSGTVWATLR
ncbi:serine hydrolase [Bifidobacterium sp. 82T24]|uniref:serine hydrolase n=1 Tax=Bifidobacterium pluvialisilvae TaxID=2834436 RepID=UPI001C5A4EC1|nr:serine hydrolase [Bifidobacterium pluvialisilvae]MBW3088058.1 serine hydrolase [Bifidobacterium pluvialisilvae]